MKNLILLLGMLSSGSGLLINGQTTEKFDIVSYSVPSGWVKQEGNDFIAYTINNNITNEYARILIYKSLGGTGNINADFEAEWNELVQSNYNPGNFINTGVSEYKDGWISKIGVAPFKSQDKNNAAVLITMVREQTKMSFVFISNGTTYQQDFENFGSSLTFEKQTAVSLHSGFTYTTSDFDDGWTGTIHKDWVLVERRNARVYLFYAVPYNSDNFSGTGIMDRDYYWDNYIANQFGATSKQYNDAGEVISSFKPKYVEGYGTDPVSGTPVFIAMALTVSPDAAQLIVASFPDEASFRQTFPKANDRFESDLAGMVRYNKFALGKTDYLGTWQSGGSRMTHWYDAVSGAYTGATVASGSATFHFFPGGTYRSIHNGATGAVGAMNTFQQEYKGNCNVSEWNIILTDRYQGKSSGFDAHYQAVRGGRLLYLNNNAGENYLLVRIK